MSKRRAKAYIYLLASAAIWGIAGPIIKFTLENFSAYTFLAYRFMLSTTVSIVILFLTKQHLPKNPKVRLTLFFWGFLTSTVALGFLFLGLEKTTVVDMTIITMANPLLITLAGTKLLGEHVTKREKLGITITILGVALTTIDPLLKNHHNGALTGNIFVALYLIVNMFSAVLAKHLTRKKVTPTIMTSTSFVVGFLTMVPIALFTEGTQIISQITSIPLPYHLGVIYMALISGNLAYTLWVKGQKTVEISEASLFSYLNPVFAIPIAIIWLGESFTIPSIMGAAVIILGLIIAESKRKKLIG